MRTAILPVVGLPLSGFSLTAHAAWLQEGAAIGLQDLATAAP